MRSLIILGTSMLLLCGCAPLPTLDNLVLHPRHKIKTTPADFDYRYEEVTVPVDPGRSVVIWYVSAAQPKALVVVVPGSSSNKGLYTRDLWLFIDDDYDVILMDYEGFGNSPGQKTLQHCADDALAVTRYALTRDDRVVLFGASLGAPVAVRAAAEYPVSGLILDGALILGQEPLLWLQRLSILLSGLGLISDLAISPQVPADFDILTYIQRVTVPKLIMHSVDDEVTTYKAGVMVYDTAPPPKEFWQMRGPHGKMIQLDPDAYAAKVRGWLDATFGYPASTSQPATSQPALGG